MCIGWPRVPASSFAEPVVAVDSDLAYGGVYIDLIEQARIDARSEEDQSSSDPDSSELYVAKYNAETGYADGITVTSAGITDRQLSFVHEGVQLDLHFVNDVLIGCRKTYEQELTDRLAGQALESCTAEEREVAEECAMEVILNNVLGNRRGLSEAGTGRLRESGAGISKRASSGFRLPKMIGNLYVSGV